MEITFAGIVEHGLLALVGWGLGTTLAAGLGYAIAFRLHSVYKSHPHYREMLDLLPWRTVLIGLLMLVCSPIAMVAIVVWLGLGAKAGAMGTVLAVFCIGVPCVVAAFLQHWLPPLRLRLRLLGTARTLAAVSVALVAGVGSYGGGGLGRLVLMSLQLLEYGTAVKGWLAFVVLALIPDVLLGVVQLIVWKASIRGDKPEE